MSNLVTLTVPNTPRALECAAAFFNAMQGAAELDEEPSLVKPCTCATRETAVLDAMAAPYGVSTTAVDDHLAPDTTETVAPAPPTETVAPAPPTETVAPAPPMATVEVDSESIPWDGRIHTSSKKFRKSDNTWKLKPGIDAQLVKQVKAELLAAVTTAKTPEDMVAAVTAAEEAYTAPNPFAATAAVETETVVAPPAPVELTAAKPVITNFVELNMAIKEADLDQATVQAAVTAVGLDNYMLLAAQPAKSIEVANILFPS